VNDDDDDDDDDFSLFQVHHLDNYKDRSPGLHMWTLPLLVPTTHSLVHHQNFTKIKKIKKKTTLVTTAHISSPSTTISN